MTAHYEEVFYYEVIVWEKLEGYPGYRKSPQLILQEDFQIACAIAEDAYRHSDVVGASVFFDNGKRLMWVKGFGLQTEDMKQTR